ncbi:MAG: dihydrolipoamide acetyltransferase [Buchnera aphidicola (Microlophium carnosum)]|uniref:Dihydrolipoamide acetyltransferase component of pyruvate dehydrogenase complex n=1 Tax=Buchnera aphidicola (Microlophium carnosum) TaxID=2708354 RepID=A0A6G9JUX2_9GAMM|nr:MAG: dihydrolipoamide acetyltransferase [Buchnera aphidicola (Microlophium carnosum)]
MDIEVKIPDIGFDEVEVIEILVNVNEKVELEQGLITVEGDKTSMEIPSPMSGVVKNIYIKIGEKIKTNSLIMMFEVDDINSYIKKKEANYLDQDIDFNHKKKIKKDLYFHATPVIRRLARHLNIDLCSVIGTGPKKRILKEDIELYQNNIKKNILEEKKIIKPNEYNTLKIEESELSSVQKTIGKNLHQNWINIPHVTQFDEVNITILENFRKKYNIEKKVQKNTSDNVTILVFIMKVVAHALEKFPIFNSSLTLDHKKIILKKYINIGFAIDVNNDLFVPVLKDVNKKNIEQLSSELILLSEKARKRKLNISDMTEGCFTISNLGGIGGSWFSPIINAPEVAILGVSKSQVKPLWNGKEFIPSLMLPLSLSYDHRVINGVYAARFITLINKLLSDVHFLIM